MPLLKILYRSFKYRRVCNEIVSLIPKEDVINMRYEDIFDQPEAALDSLAGFIGLKDISVPEFMELRGDHTIGGTPNRFQKRRIERDDSWKSHAERYPIFNFAGSFLNKIS